MSSNTVVFQLCLDLFHLPTAILLSIVCSKLKSILQRKGTQKERNYTKKTIKYKEKCLLVYHLKKRWPALSEYFDHSVVVNIKGITEHAELEETYQDRVQLQELHHVPKSVVQMPLELCLHQAWWCDHFLGSPFQCPFTLWVKNLYDTQLNPPPYSASSPVTGHEVVSV